VLWAADSTTVELLAYGRAELKTSDHRPVFAVFRVHVLRPEQGRTRAVLADLLGFFFDFI
jgi:hypothetical protein